MSWDASRDAAKYRRGPARVRPVTRLTIVRDKHLFNIVRLYPRPRDRSFDRLAAEDFMTYPETDSRKLACREQTSTGDART